MTIAATVLQRGEPRFNMVGQRLPSSLHDTDQTISAGLVQRLHAFARKRLTDAGFSFADWACEVYTMDADLPASERYYTVEFVHDLGAVLGVQGIGTNRGWPQLDHGIFASER
jgi:hypothetical protein